MITFVTHGHTIEIQPNTTFSAVEQITYDGEVVSRHSSLAGSTHTFETTEEGEAVRYEVTIGLHLPSSLGYVSVKVQRNGELILAIN